MAENGDGLAFGAGAVLLLVYYFTRDPWFAATGTVLLLFAVAGGALAKVGIGPLSVEWRKRIIKSIAEGVERRTSQSLAFPSSRATARDVDVIDTANLSQYLASRANTVASSTGPTPEAFGDALAEL